MTGLSKGKGHRARFYNDQGWDPSKPNTCLGFRVRLEATLHPRHHRNLPGHFGGKLSGSCRGLTT